jgi:hypothetical protein
LWVRILLSIRCLKRKYGSFEGACEAQLRRVRQMRLREYPF